MENVDLVKRIYASHVSNDLEAVMECCAEAMRVEWMAGPENSPYTGSTRGRDSFRQRLESLHEAFDYLQLDVIDIVAAGDRVATRVKITLGGRNTGAKFVIDCADFWTVQDGKVTEFIEYYDSALAGRMTAMEMA